MWILKQEVLEKVNLSNDELKIILKEQTERFETKKKEKIAEANKNAENNNIVFFI